MNPSVRLVLWALLLMLLGLPVSRAQEDDGAASRPEHLQPRNCAGCSALLPTRSPGSSSPEQALIVYEPFLLLRRTGNLADGHPVGHVADENSRSPWPGWPGF